MSQEVEVALLKQKVDDLEEEVTRLIENQQAIRDTMKIGKGMLAALIFVLGSGALALGEGLKRVFGLE